MQNRGPDHSPSQDRRDVASAISIANPIRGRVNACGYRLLMPVMHRAYGKIKAQLFRDLPSSVTEIGPGIGTNFRYYSPGSYVSVVEPNRYLTRRLHQTAEQNEIALQSIAGSAESIDLPDESVDAVVATLVLCSVVDPQRALGEILRILRPGGRFLFLEHVRSPHGGANAIVQRMLFYPWRWTFEGCHLRRDTERLIRQAGFREVGMERFQLKPSLIPFAPHIYGVAVK